MDIDLPFSIEHEQGAIGAALLLDGDKRQRAVLRLATGWDFYDDIHGWIWGRIKRGAFDVAAFRECRWRFGRPLGPVIEACLRDTFWWNGVYHAEVVAELSKARKQVLDVVRAGQIAVRMAGR